MVQMHSIWWECCWHHACTNNHNGKSELLKNELKRGKYDIKDSAIFFNGSYRYHYLIATVRRRFFLR